MTERRVRVREKPVIFIAEDIPKNLQLLCKLLTEENYKIAAAGDGRQAYEMIPVVQPDLILLDVMMPEMNGFEVAEHLQKKRETKDIPIIFLTAKSDSEDIIKGFDTGAVDYVTKPFKKKELLARIRTQLELKISKDKILMINQQLEVFNNALEMSNKALEKELNEAADYVKTMLPSPLEADPCTDWCFKPSSQLGGDIFGYYWLDDDHFVVYLLDVCGHGVGAALLSVSVLQMLSLQTLADTDFFDPADVLRNLNDNFLLKTDSSNFFSIWYGVYKRSEHKLLYSSAGHPPAILLMGPDMDGATLNELRTPGALIGVIPGFEFVNEEIELDNVNVLFVYSDGVYEIRKVSDSKMWKLSEWIELLEEEARRTPPRQLDEIKKYIQKLGGTEHLEDDFSLIRIQFPPVE